MPSLSCSLTAFLVTRCLITHSSDAAAHYHQQSSNGWQICIQGKGLSKNGNSSPPEFSSSQKIKLRPCFSTITPISPELPLCLKQIHRPQTEQLFCHLFKISYLVSTLSCDHAILWELNCNCLLVTVLLPGHQHLHCEPKWSTAIYFMLETFAIMGMFSDFAHWKLRTPVFHWNINHLLYLVCNFHLFNFLFSLTRLTNILNNSFFLATPKPYYISFITSYLLPNFLIAWPLIFFPSFLLIWPFFSKPLSPISPLLLLDCSSSKSIDWSFIPVKFCNFNFTVRKYSELVGISKSQ